MNKLPRSSKPSLAAWLATQAGDPRHVERCGPLTEVRLCHVGADREPDGQVAAFSLGEADDAAQVAELVSDAAGADAASLRGVQTYAALAVHSPPDGGEPVSRARYTFVVRGESQPTADGFDTEPPTMRGLLAQTQRHMEQMARLYQAGMAQSMQSLANQNEKFAAMLDDAADTRLEMTRALGDVLLRREEAAAVRAEAADKASLRTEAARKLMGYLPVVMGKMLGGKLLPAGDGAANDALRGSVRSFATSLTEQQYMSLLGILTPEQQLVATEMFQELLRESEGKPEDASGAGGAAGPN